ncbi:MAG: DUF1294 domain-containing protein [Blautia sp.]|nr:DUF1294 domain-containing protein [Blautia sp.]
MRVIVWLIIINLLTFMLFVVDKERAVRHQYRISEFTLLALAFMGGSAGALLAMSLVRHKTKKKIFTVGIRLMLAMHVVLLGIYLYNSGYFGTLL